MANLTITNTFTAGTTAASAQVNTNYSDIKTWLNNRDNGTDFWLNMKVSGTASNPGEIKSSSTDCEFDVDCTGTNGTPRYSLKRSGTTYYTWGVDGAASNLFKFGTTALTTNIAFQIPSTGAQMQFPNGSNSIPSVSFINGSNFGMYLNAGGGKLMFTSNGVDALAIVGSNQQLQAVSGSSSAPAYAFASQAGTGFYYALNGSFNELNVSAGGAQVAVFRSNNDVILSANGPLATNATGGFTFLPAMAGTPTGAVTNATGTAAIVIDTTGSKIWVRVGSSWKSVAVA